MKSELLKPVSQANRLHDFDEVKIKGSNIYATIQGVLKAVESRISPVWPLKDYVAVNPYLGYSDQKFLDACNFLQGISDAELLMPIDYYRRQFECGAFVKSDIDTAIDEMVADGVPGAELIDVNQIVALLNKRNTRHLEDSEDSLATTRLFRMKTLAQQLDEAMNSDWCSVIRDEISKHCATHYDQGHSIWQSSLKLASLYQSWQWIANRDRSFEIHGVTGFRTLVASLPRRPEEALVELLKRLGVPKSLWYRYLLCVAMNIQGWSAWTKYQSRQATLREEENSGFTGLLTMWLAYEVGLSDQFGHRIDWATEKLKLSRLVEEQEEPATDQLVQYALLKASEICFRKQFVAEMQAHAEQSRQQITSVMGNSAQMVFCIDVRSERIRRNLEENSSKIETFGFAGFFGLPIEYVPFGGGEPTSQVPVLISPKMRVYEDIVGDRCDREAAMSRCFKFRFVRKAWKSLQSSAVSAFAFVETTGLLYGMKLIGSSFRSKPNQQDCCSDLKSRDKQHLSPSLETLDEQGIDLARQADLAESILRGIGIVNKFSRLIVFCGHASQTNNNPLKAGLDCGACGGHSGEVNARLAAKLLNQPSVRQLLKDRGLLVPDDTVFAAAVHNTTTDDLEFFETDLIPRTHHSDLKELLAVTKIASEQTRAERQQNLSANNGMDLYRRSCDWSEVRPEWGLAGNAAFIAAPRSLTKSISLNGRAFLHSYDHQSDSSFALLEQIMTAPLVVAHWINMQYYGSTVDPNRFGSGNKAIHNVVGNFGVYSGNGGDLMTGLPWQSIHDGKRYQHSPLRLMAVIAAPRHAVEAVLARHADIRALIENEWIHLIAVENDEYYRYSKSQRWESLRHNVAIPIST